MIFEIAGRLGVDPGPFTLRELLWMDEARFDAAWDHTAQVCAQLGNIHRANKNSRRFTIADFHPKGKRRKRKSPDRSPHIELPMDQILTAIFGKKQPATGPPQPTKPV